MTAKKDNCSANQSSSTKIQSRKFALKLISRTTEFFHIARYSLAYRGTPPLRATSKVLDPDPWLMCKLTRKKLESPRGEELLPQLIRSSNLLKQLRVLRRDDGMVRPHGKLDHKLSSLPWRTFRVNAASVVMHNEVARHQIDAVLG